MNQVEARKIREAKSDIVDAIPRACQDETAAVEFLEQQRWDGVPACPHCGDTAVYQMKDAKTGQRSKRYLWRCHGCKKQFTVRVGTVYEESRIALRHWCYAFWRASTSKKGVSALEIMRHTQISYKSALFLLHRIRYAMGPAEDQQAPLTGIIEADETYVGGKPRWHVTQDQLGETVRPKTPVAAQVQRGGQVRAQVIAWVTADTITQVLQGNVDASARLMTDEARWYITPGKAFAGHETVCHSHGEYARGDVTTNRVEGFFALLKRGIYGVYHSVSPRHLHLYVSEFAFRFNHRNTNDGERTAAAIRAADGRRLMYQQPKSSSNAG